MSGELERGDFDVAVFVDLEARHSAEGAEVVVVFAGWLVCAHRLDIVGFLGQLLGWYLFALVRESSSLCRLGCFRPSPSWLPSSSEPLEFACPGRRITLFVFLIPISGRIPRSERKTTITNTNRDCKAGKAVPLYYHQIVYMLRPKYPDTGWTSSVRGDNIIII